MQTERGSGVTISLTDKIRSNKLRLLLCLSFGAVCTVAMMSKGSQDIDEKSLASRIILIEKLYIFGPGLGLDFLFVQ